jgi:hypothetical protein
MRLVRSACLATALMISQGMLAELAIPSRALGQIEGTLDFCSQLSPKEAAKYKERGKAMVSGATEKDLAKARTSDEYKESYSWIQTELHKASKDDALKACSDFADDK